MLRLARDSFRGKEIGLSVTGREKKTTQSQSENDTQCDQVGIWKLIRSNRTLALPRSESLSWSWRRIEFAGREPNCRRWGRSLLFRCSYGRLYHDVGNVAAGRTLSGLIPGTGAFTDQTFKTEFASLLQKLGIVFCEGDARCWRLFI